MRPEERIFEIIAGSKRFSITLAGDGVVSSMQPEGYSDYTITPHSHDLPIVSTDDMLITESWNLVIGAQDADRVDDLVDEFIDMMRDAFLFNMTPRGRRRPPVYIMQRAAGETNIRYAPVRDCPSMQMPNPMFDLAFEQESLIDGAGFQLRRYTWREGAPQDIGTAMTLPATDGPADADFIQVVNIQDGNAGIDTIFRYDASGPTWSANLVGTDHAMFPAVPAIGDIYYLGSDYPHWHWAMRLSNNPDLAITSAYEYWDGVGGAWAAVTYITNRNFYPLLFWNGTPAGQDILFNYMPDPATWQKTTENGSNKYWTRIRITGYTSGSPPEGILYTPRTPELRIPANAFNGDISPLLLLRLKHAYAASTTPVMTATSRVLIGLKSGSDRYDLDDFASRLNFASTGNPSGWTLGLGTDAGLFANPWGVGGEVGLVDFGTVATEVVRWTFTGVDKMLPYTGRYKVFLIGLASSGYTEGDITVRLRVIIDNASATPPLMDYPAVSPVQSADDGIYFDPIDLVPGRTIELPFSDPYYADEYSGADLVFQILMARSAGAAQMFTWQLVFIPADEWIVDLFDPISNSVYGSSALRGNTLLDVDSGIVALRTAKKIMDGADIYPAETWLRRSPPMQINPGREARLYFLMGSYMGDTWGLPPMTASPVSHLEASLYHQDRFLFMRGDR